MSDDPPRITLVENPYTPRVDADGVPLSRLRPYHPVARACGVCPARCCHLPVTLSLPDVVRLCDVLSLPFAAALVMVPSPKSTASFVVDYDARYCGEPGDWTGEAVIQLRRDETGACVGVHAIGAERRCGIYAARPGFCRTYPMAWHSDRHRGGAATVLCPVPYALCPAEAEAVEAAATTSDQYWTWHEAVVAEWAAARRDDRSPAAFLAFSLPRVAERTGDDAEWALRTGTAPERLRDAMATAGMLPSVGPAPPASDGAAPSLPSDQDPDAR